MLKKLTENLIKRATDTKKLDELEHKCSVMYLANTFTDEEYQALTDLIAIKRNELKVA